MTLSDALDVVRASPDFRLLTRIPETLARPAPDDGPTGFALIADTETTGMDRQRDKVIEIGLLLVRYHKASGLLLEAVDSYSALEDPGEPLNDIVKTVTGLSDEHLAGQHIDDARVMKIAEKADLVIAHNASFDRPFMERRWPVFKDKAFACSINEIDWMAAGYASAKLEMLALKSGVFYDSHRALNDCWALLYILALDIGGPGNSAFRQLLEQARQPSWLISIQVRFDDKDRLKAIGGFQWMDGGTPPFPAKSWLRRCRDGAERDEVLERIRNEVFRGDAFDCQVGRVTAMRRYSLDQSGLSLTPLRCGGE
ncbi:3'-5' exonuclease [Paludibacterium paludis]|nr:3'-5' exonuclease [Paludibacterium paludis]